MVLKIFKGVWFLSLFGWLTLFMYVYASLPADVVLREGVEQIRISRGALFYSFLGIVSIINGLVFSIGRLYATQQAFLSWFYGLIVCLNVFFVIVLNVLNVMNSGEKFDYTRLGLIIYGSLTLFIAWAVAWPCYQAFLKISGKQPV